MKFLIFRDFLEFFDFFEFKIDLFDLNSLKIIFLYFQAMMWQMMWQNIRLPRVAQRTRVRVCVCAGVRVRVCALNMNRQSSLMAGVCDAILFIGESFLKQFNLKQRSEEL